MTLYTNDVRNYMHSLDWPTNVNWTVTEKMDPLPHLYLLFFADNWKKLNGEDVLKTKQLVDELMWKLWNDGVPIYLARVEGNG